jgi:3',5'-cyclic AMP phosphodiesterase CpdA
MLHEKVPLPDGDTLIHCGDFCNWGTPEEVRQFLDWFVDTPYTNKILVAGNHDVFLDGMKSQGNWPDYFKKTGFHYLIDSGITIEGIKFWGSPWIPYIVGGWAFESTSKELDSRFSLIPDDTDVLVTHAPPWGILDSTGYRNIGSGALHEHTMRVKPKYHLFGHCHESYGKIVDDMSKVTFINAAIAHRIDRLPFVFEVKNEMDKRGNRAI